MSKIAIVTDSSANIPPSLMQNLNIHIIPLWLLWDQKRYRDNVDIDTDTFYQRLKTSKTLPSSSQPTPGEFIDFFNNLAVSFDTIVAPLVSSNISGTFASAMLAKNELPDLNIELIDTRQGAMGAGLAVLTTARLAAAGETVKDIVEKTKKVCQKTYMFFVVDTLEYLHRGGRIGGAKRLLGSVLKIKPLLHFHEGTIQPLASIRTKTKAVARLLELVEERIADSRIVEAAVMDIDVPDEGDSLADKLKERFGIPAVYRTGVSPVVGTHVGPGALGVAFSIE